MDGYDRARSILAYILVLYKELLQTRCLEEADCPDLRFDDHFHVSWRRPGQSASCNTK